MDWKIIAKPEDLTEEVIERAADYATGYLLNGDRVDWEDVLYRVEVDLRVDFGISHSSPAISELKKRTRKRLAE